MLKHLTKELFYKIVDVKDKLTNEEYNKIVDLIEEVKNTKIPRKKLINESLFNDFLNNENDLVVRIFVQGGDMVEFEFKTSNLQSRLYHKLTERETDTDFFQQVTEELLKKLISDNLKAQNLYLMTNIEDDGEGDFTFETLLPYLVLPNTKNIYVHTKHQAISANCSGLTKEVQQKLHIYCNECDCYLKYSNITKAIKKKHDH